MKTIEDFQNYSNKILLKCSDVILTCGAEYTLAESRILRPIFIHYIEIQNRMLGYLSETGSVLLQCEDRRNMWAKLLEGIK